MKLVVLVGRILFASIFILALPSHFSHAAIQYAQMQSIPAPHVIVPLAGIFSFIGGLSILLGYRSKHGAWLIILFLAATNFSMHRFWMFPDPITKEFQQLMFMKNISLLGAAFIISFFGSGPYSLDKQIPAKTKG